MEKICCIIGAGDMEKADIPHEFVDFIICADGGYKNSRLLGRECDLVVGDFDSLGRVPEKENVITAPTEKDETDLMLAFLQGYERGYRDFVILGALGGERFDHSMGNIQLLSLMAHKGARGRIFHKGQCLTVIKDSFLGFTAREKGYISVFSLSDESRGVTIENLKYPLENAVLTRNKPIGVSNEFLGKESRISVSQGELLIIYQKSY